MFVRILMILGLASLLFGCYSDEISPDGKESGNDRSSNQIFNAKNEDKTDSSVEVIGSFSNRDGNGTHEWGYEVDLWSHDGNLIGMFTGSLAQDLLVIHQPVFLKM